MKTGIACVMVAGLTGGMLTFMPQKAAADDYFAVVAPRAVMAEQSDSVIRMVDRTICYPVVLERSCSASTMIVGTSLCPVMLEKTTTARPHHLLFSIGVWP